MPPEKPPLRRIDSPPPISRPPPVDLAPPDAPQSIREARQRGRDLVAEADRRDPPDARKAWLSGLLDKAVVAIIAAVLGGGTGAATTASAKNTPSLPPGVLECPAQLEQARKDVTRAHERIDRLESRDDQGRELWRKTNEKTEDALGEIAKLKKRVPEPVTP